MNEPDYEEVADMLVENLDVQRAQNVYLIDEVTALHQRVCQLESLCRLQLSMILLQLQTLQQERQGEVHVVPDQVVLSSRRAKL